MLGDEDAFFAAFTGGNPEALTSRRLGNRRTEILTQAVGRTEVGQIVSADFINETIFDARNEYGLYRLFQRAVHLITAERIELRTEPENFNFIFKNHNDDDVYIALYNHLPAILLYLSHVLFELFERIKRMDRAAKQSFYIRSALGFSLLNDGEELIQKLLTDALSPLLCPICDTAAKFTRYNSARTVMMESFRCTACRRHVALPFSWLF